MLDTGAQPPAWQPLAGSAGPASPAGPAAPEAHRDRVVLADPGPIAVGLGVLGIYDSSHEVVDGAYPALALGITAVMLLVGSIVGRPGGLILLGFLTSIALAGSVVVGGSYGVDAKEVRESPTTSAQVRSDYTTTVGDIRLDLTGVTDPEALAGRELDLHLRTGYIQVIVPRTLNVRIAADMDVAGGSGSPATTAADSTTRCGPTSPPYRASSSAPLELDLDGQVRPDHRGVPMNDIRTRPVSIAHLVFGLIFLGAAGLWAVGAATDADTPTSRSWRPACSSPPASSAWSRW